MDVPKKRQLRFGLRTLLLAVLAVACSCMLGIRIYNGMPMNTKINRVFPGMSPAEVEKKIGLPYAIQRSNPESADPQRQIWYYGDNWEVTFDYDKVTIAEQVVIVPPRTLKVPSDSTKPATPPNSFQWPVNPLPSDPTP